MKEQYLQIGNRIVNSAMIREFTLTGPEKVTIHWGGTENPRSEEFTGENAAALYAYGTKLAKSSAVKTLVGFTATAGNTGGGRARTAGTGR